MLIIAFMLISGSVFAEPGNGMTREDRKQARIERQMERRVHPRDERTREQKRRDRSVLLVMAIGAGLIVKGLSGEE